MIKHFKNFMVKKEKTCEEILLLETGDEKREEKYAIVKLLIPIITNGYCQVLRSTIHQVITKLKG